MYRSEQGCALCRGALEARNGETFEAWTRRQVEAEDLIDFEGFCALVGQVDPALAHLLRQRATAEALAIALQITEEVES